MRHVFALIVAEVVVFGFAWCASARGRACLSRLFGNGRAANPDRVNKLPIIDI